MRWNYRSIPRYKWKRRWSLEINELFHPTHYRCCDYVSMLWFIFKLIQIDKRGPLSPINVLPIPSHSTRQTFYYLLWPMIPESTLLATLAYRMSDITGHVSLVYIVYASRYGHSIEPSSPFSQKTFYISHELNSSLSEDNMIVNLASYFVYFKQYVVSNDKHDGLWIMFFKTQVWGRILFIDLNYLHDNLHTFDTHQSLQNCSGLLMQFTCNV